MKKNIPHVLAICCSTAVLATIAPASSRACGSGHITITNLPNLDQASYQVYALGPKGQFTGFSMIPGVHGPHAFRYDGGALTDLGTLGGPSSIGYSLNATGQITGQADVDNLGQSHAFLYSGGGLTDLGTLGGVLSSGVVINDHGQVAGWSLPAKGSEVVAFLFANGSLSGLGTLGGSYSSSFGLNNNGDVAGESTLTNGDTHGFVYHGAPMTDLGTLGGNYSSAFALSDGGIVVGESSLANGDTHAFAYAAGAMVDLGTVGGTYSSAFLISTNNQIAGNGTSAGDQAMHGFIYAQGTLTDLGTLGGDRCTVWAMNNRIQIVGDSDQADGTRHAFLWANGKITDLNDLLPANSGWEVVSAEFINDAGRVVGYGNYNGSSQWFVMDLPTGDSPPVAIAGPDQVVDCQTAVHLDGSASHNAANDPLNFEWSLAGNVLDTNPTLSVSLPLGTNIVKLRVTDPCGASSETNVVITVLDTTAPAILSQPARIKVPAGDDCHGIVPNVLAEVIATDNCTPTQQLVATQNPAAGTSLLEGRHHISVTVADASGNTTTCKVALVVCDVTAPAIHSVTASPGLLSTPNHKMVPVTITVAASDNCDPAPVSKIVRVTCNESMDRDDVEVTADLRLKLAATRNPAGPGRIYTIKVKCTDASGNCTDGTVQITVPKPNDPVPTTGGGTQGHH